MKPNETIRFVCHECLTVFDICLAPPSEWPEADLEDDGSPIDINVNACPFCGSADVKPKHDAPEIRTATQKLGHYRISTGTCGLPTSGVLIPLTVMAVSQGRRRRCHSLIDRLIC
jgi:hypothetical protein